MKKIYSCLLCLFIVSHLLAQENKSINMNLDKVKLHFMLDEHGAPNYEVYFNNTPVIKRSKLGIALTEDKALEGDFEWLSTDKIQVDETWKPV